MLVVPLVACVTLCTAPCASEWPGHHGGLLLPPFYPQTGHLPCGRYGATLAELEERLVLADDMSASATRRDIWDGFERWLGTWGEIEAALDLSGLLHRLWLGGSFVSALLDPDDIDVAVFVDKSLYDQASGRPGARSLRRVIGHRSKVAATYRVEPFVVWWLPLGAILRHGDLLVEERDYLAQRGTYDDLWQRVRPDGPKGPPQAEHAVSRRGYVEVIW
jgi:hypothetical protein